MRTKVNLDKGTPLSSNELEKDAQNANVDSDEVTSTGGDTHMPASEAGTADKMGTEEARVERDITNLPPD